MISVVSTGPDTACRYRSLIGESYSLIIENPSLIGWKISLFR
jgi:hypothetical protein